MKPVMGYPSQIAAIRALTAQGMQLVDIAQQLGMSLENVKRTACTAKEREPRSFAYDKRQRVYLAPHTIAALKPYADMRGIVPTKLVQQLVNAIVRDDIVDAVLDDQEPVA